jgi:GR25 family glycosyltransferase involved in LPS biosynthesis
VDRNYPAALIFEDDIQLVEGFRSKLSTYLGHLCEETRCGEGPVDVALLGALGMSR